MAKKKSTPAFTPTTLAYTQQICPLGVQPFDTVTWSKRTAKITDSKGTVIFQQQDCEFPDFWSDTAVNVVASKYFYGPHDRGDDPAAGGREHSVRQLIHRVANAIRLFAITNDRLTTADANCFYNDIVYLCLHQFAAFNSPVWFNIGLYESYGIRGDTEAWHWDQNTSAINKVLPGEAFKHGQASACFIMSVGDDMSSIAERALKEMRLFKQGSGSGTDNSTIRSKREKLSGGGNPSGPVSFLKIYDAVADTTKSGGKCLAPHQPVFTSHGIKTAKELVEANLPFHVLSWSQRLGRMIDKEARIWQSGTKPVVTVITDKGEFHVSADHPFMLHTGEPRRAIDLEAGTRLMSASIYSHDYWHLQIEPEEPGHEVVEVRPIDTMPVYSIEVVDLEEDDKRQWSEHNYLLASIGAVDTTTDDAIGAKFSGVCVFNTRRAAKMETLECVHPDIKEFIDAKSAQERIAHKLIDAGWSADYNTGAYSEVKFQNSNFSVRASDDFMRLATFNNATTWQTLAVTTGTARNTHDEQMPLYSASKLLDEISTGTWFCGDPGMQFSTTINSWHTCPNTSNICSSNPCSEYLFINDSACNLASIRLTKFLVNSEQFNADMYGRACQTILLAQELLVDYAGYPAEDIAKNSHDFRPLGLGFCDLGALLMRLGIAYDSDEGRQVAGLLTTILQGNCAIQSAAMAKAFGSFAGYSHNKMAMDKVIDRHYDEALSLCARDTGPKSDLVYYLGQATLQTWYSVDVGRHKHGYRNAQFSVQAPTGTISFMMDADTTGVEPDIALVKYKLLAGGGNLKLVNQCVAPALTHLKYGREAIKDILAYIETHDTIDGAPRLEPEHLEIFDCALPAPGTGRSISPAGHIKMMAAIQPHISGAISKTVNAPETTTVQEIREMYILAWNLGVKAIAIYRDGSKRSQPLSTSKDSKEHNQPTQVVAIDCGPVRERLTYPVPSTTYKLCVADHKIFMTVGHYPDGRPGEVFLTGPKEGSTVSGLLDAFATSFSYSLQYGVPLEQYVNKFAHGRYEPHGITNDKDVPIVSSITDFVLRKMGMVYLPAYAASMKHGYESSAIESTNESGLVDTVILQSKQRVASEFSRLAITSMSCGKCGGLMRRAGACYRCDNCGETTGCG